MSRRGSITVECDSCYAEIIYTPFDFFTSLDGMLEDDGWEVLEPFGQVCCPDCLVEGK